MDLQEFIGLYEQAKLGFPAELARISIPNPLLPQYTFFKTMEGLRQDWAEYGGDPGKHKPHRFFVRDYAVDGSRVVRVSRFWVADAVDDLAKARGGVPCRALGTDARVPVPLGDLADAAHAACNGCGRQGPIIGSYAQTRNSLEFDEWTLSLAVLCAGCRGAKKFASASECRRFLHEVEVR